MLQANKVTAPDTSDLIVDIFATVKDLPQDFQQLMDAASGESLQFGMSWMLNLEQSVFGEKDHVRYFTLRRNGQAVAVLPTLLARQTRGRHIAALGNYYTAIFQPAMLPGLPAAAWKPLLNKLRAVNAGLTSLTLSPMDPDSEAFVALELALSLSGFAAYRYFCFGNWYLKAPRNWAEYLASREGKQRSTIKRMSQRITADNGRVEILTSTQDLERGLTAYLHVYERSWKIPEPSPQFIPGLMRLCSQAGAMRLGIVWLKDQPIAAQLWIVSNGRAEIYKVAYDEAFKSHSPGTVLTAQLIQYALEIDGVREIDYLIGDDPYKKNWMSHRRERWGLVAYNKRSFWGIVGAASESFGRTTKPLRLACRDGFLRIATKLKIKAIA